MRNLWIDNGNGTLVIDTGKLHAVLRSQAVKNYRANSSVWKFYFYLKGKTQCHIYCSFGGTIEEAFEQAESMIYELYDAVKEIV